MRRAWQWLTVTTALALSGVAQAQLEEPLEAGEKAPEWNITATKGLPKTAKLSDYKGKYVVLDFWGFWCPPCVGMSMPGWMDFAEKHKDQKDAFVIITVHETGRGVTNADELQPKIDALKDSKWGGRALPFPVIFDTTNKTLEAYKISAFPTAYLIDPKGKIVTAEVGYEGKVERKLERALKELKKKKGGDKKEEASAEKKKDDAGGTDVQAGGDTPEGEKPAAEKPKADKPKEDKPKASKPKSGTPK